jgi:hypothetical protein
VHQPLAHGRVWRIDSSAPIAAVLICRIGSATPLLPAARPMRGLARADGPTAQRADCPKPE